MREILERISDMVFAKISALPSDFDSSGTAGMGASGSSTSLIDKVAEDVIIDYIESNDLNLNILSEEAGYLDRGAEQTIVVDPIDGTANYHSEIPFYSVSLAIGIDALSNVSHGLVRNLVNGDIYYAEKGKGAWMNNIRINTRSFSQEESLFLAYVGNQADRNICEFIDKPRRVRSLGCASLEMCHVARGRADGFYFNCLDFAKRMRIVDIAASSLALREAGGGLFGLDGTILDMKFSLDDRANFFALGDPRAKEMMI